VFLNIKDMRKSKYEKSFFENPTFPVAFLTVWLPVTFKFPLKREFRFEFQVYVVFLPITYHHFTFVHTAATEVHFCFGEFVVRKLCLSLTSLMKSCQHALYSTIHVMHQPHNICTWLHIKLLSNIPCGALNNIILW
jgi:hypothetical protein